MAEKVNKQNQANWKEIGNRKEWNKVDQLTEQAKYLLIRN